MAQVIRRSFLVREVLGSNSEPIKSPTRCQQLATAASFEVGALAQSREDGHCSHVTPERILITCLHDQNKSGLFGGPAFIQPIRAI